MLPTLAWQLSPQTKLHTPRERLLKILELKCIVIHMIQIWTSVCIINIRGFSTCVRWVYFGLKMRCCFFFFSPSVCNLCVVLVKNYFQAWELSAKMHISVAVKLTPQREKIVCREKKSGGGGKKEGSTSFSSDHEIYGARAHTAVTHLNHLIVNTVTAVTLAGMH